MREEKIYKFLQEAGPVFFVTPNAGRALGLEKELPDYHIVCAQEPTGIELLRRDGVKIFCLGKDVKNSGRLLLNAEVVKYIQDNSNGRIANVVTFKPSPMIEKACEKNGFRYLGNDSRINRIWEDKVKFAEITGMLGIPNAGSIVMRIEKDTGADFLDFSGGRKYVIQFSRGYSGNSTFLAENREDFEKIVEGAAGRKVKISNYKEGDTYTFNACIGEFGTLISRPIFQITGFQEFNKNLLGTCGNDYSFGKNLDDEVLKGVHISIRQVSDRLSQAGYRGILGFDFVVSGEDVDLIEVNPRLVGSIPVFTKLQLAAGETPFLLLHILSFLDFDFSAIEIKEPEKVFEFSQVILRNNRLHGVKVEKTLAGGIYKLISGDIVFKERSYCAPSVMASDEFFVECVSEGGSVDPDMEYANIQLNYGIMEAKSNFKKEFLRVKSEVLKKIILK